MPRLRAADLATLDSLSSRLYVCAREVKEPLAGELLKNIACALLEARDVDAALATLMLIDDLLHTLHRDGHLDLTTTAALVLGTRLALEPDPDAPARPEVQ